MKRDGGLVMIMCCLTLTLNLACSSAPVSESAGEALAFEDPDSIVLAALARQLKQALTLQVSLRSEADSWLLLGGQAQKPDGGSLDLSGTQYQSAVDAGAFENTFLALLQQKINTPGYQLVELSYGSTDTPIERWRDKHALPEALLPERANSESLQWQ